MQTVEVQKLNTSGKVVVTYEAELAERVPGGVRLEARWTRAPLALGFTAFETGDRFIEWFFGNRWHNIFEIASADGVLKGWYCNIAEPAVITEHAVSCVDLLLDLWVAPDGTTRVLDEDELAADTVLDDATRARAYDALDELMRMVRGREGPFARIGDRDGP
jgi:predicted RNA-binding protein associated with RNAse of E/G family